MDNSLNLIPRAASPEEVGVSSKAIECFLTETEKRELDIHSFMIIRHGKVAAECYRAPFTAERPHAMYSVSKTVTATAIGIAADEKLISLDDKVRDFFPDYTENICDTKLDSLTVRHLLTMTSGKDPSVFADKSNGNWMEYYFSAPWYNEPGKEFRYINENIYILSAIIKRATGDSVRRFLKPRLFEKLGIDYPFWETDQYGIEAGGWGLYLKTEDLAKIMLTYSNKGVYNGKRIMSEKWVNYASGKIADTSSEFDKDAKAGYGCCLWRCADVNAYRADGMFSQYGIVFEDYDAVVVVTSAIAQQQICRDLLWEFFPNAFIEESCGNEESAKALYERLKNAKLDSLTRNSSSVYEKKTDGCEIHFRKKIFLNLIGFPMSMLPLAVTYMTTDRAGNIDKMILNYRKSDMLLTWTEGDETNTIPVGLDGKYRYGNMRLGQIDYKVCSNAVWLSEDRLFIQIRPLETIGRRKLDIKFFENGRVKMKPSSDPDVFTIAMNLAPGFEAMIGNKKITDRIIPLFRFAPNLLEPTLKGRIIYKK
ncbi:MAG: serine hydrolase [Clostridia bacterium]|nr:serine hydrolase [Clostridia bacterium]